MFYITLFSPNGCGIEAPHYLRAHLNSIANFSSVACDAPLGGLGLSASGPAMQYPSRKIAMC